MRKLPEQPVVGVAELYEPGVGYQHENPLEKIDERVSRHREKRAEPHIEYSPVTADISEPINQMESKISHNQGQEDKERRDKLLPSLVEISV